MNIRFTVEIDGKNVPMCAGPMTKRIYKKTFQGDLIKNIVNFTTNYNNDLYHNEKLAQIIWSFAKIANPTLPNYNDWVDSCDSIPVKDILFQILEKMKEGDMNVK